MAPQFVSHSQRIVRYSDNALTRMREAVATLDMDAVRAGHRPDPRAAGHDCGQPGCRQGTVLASARTV